MTDGSNTSSTEGFVPIEQVAGIVKEAEEAKKPSPRQAIQESVKSRLAGAGPQVRDAVVAALTDVELKRREKAVISIIEKLDSKAKELQKGMRSGQVVFGPDEKPLPPTFTKEQLEANRKLREEIQKMEAALTKSLENNDWQKLFELTEKG